MRNIENFVDEVLGQPLKAKPLVGKQQHGLPLYISEGYELLQGEIFDQIVILVKIKNESAFSILKLDKHLNVLKQIFTQPVIVLFDEVAAYKRKRLIEKKINFIVLDKQLFIPALMVDLKEQSTIPKVKTKKLLPIAQLLIVYHLLYMQKKWKIEDNTFKDNAAYFNTNAMAISRAADNIQQLGLIVIEGERDKNIRFQLDNIALWQEIERRELWVNPILKKVYVDKIPEGVTLLRSNTSALPEYSEMNPSKQHYYAIEKKAFYDLQKNKVLVNANETEGEYCLEVWNYNPLTLIKEMNAETPAVDPLSLYLSLKNIKDERIEMALEQIIEKYIW